MPIAVPVPERRAQAEGRPSSEGQPPQRERGERGNRREKWTRERQPVTSEAAPPEGSQDPAESRQATRAAADLGGPPPQEQSVGGLPGVHRRGSRRGGAPRGERSGGQGTPATEAEGASKPVDAPPGIHSFSIWHASFFEAAIHMASLLISLMQCLSACIVSWL